MTEIVLCAAHGGIGRGVPVGGGAAVVHALWRAWAGRPFAVRLLGLGAGRELLAAGPPADNRRYERLPVDLPGGQDPDRLVTLNEWQYARLCHDFEAAATARLLAGQRPGQVVVVNDLSEAPDLARLAAAGLPVIVLWHVDVVDYFCRFYLGGLDPARAMQGWRALGAGARRLPAVLRLVFEKQSRALAHAAAHVVPSVPMRDIIARCFPGSASRLEVIPWGAWGDAAEADAVAAERERLRRELGLVPGGPVLLTLSRLSPEKGLERALEALRYGEQRGQVPEGTRLLIAGEAAYMMGRRYLASLRHRAAGLRRARVDFVGYAAGARKAALFELADLYLFPSRHESYGLTLAEALRAGVPVISTDHYSARELVRDAGVVLGPGSEPQIARSLWQAIDRLWRDAPRRAHLAAAARRRAASLSFDRAADRLAALAGSLARRAR